MKFNELMSPGICIICEGGCDGIEFYDTNYNLQLDTIVHLSGRKYVCEICFNAMAEHWGYEASNQVDHALAVKEEVKAELKALYDSLEVARNEAIAKWHQIEATPVKVRGRPRKNPLPVELTPDDKFNAV